MHRAPSETSLDYSTAIGQAVRDIMAMRPETPASDAPDKVRRLVSDLNA